MSKARAWGLAWPAAFAHKFAGDVVGDGVIVTPAEPMPAKSQVRGERAAVKASGHANWAKHVDVLAYVESAAEAMKTQRTISATLKKAIRTFEDAMNANKGENPLRVAFETGRAKAEQKHIDLGNSLSPKNAKEIVGWIFFTKAQFGWRDKPENSSSDAPRISFLLPGPMSEAEYLKKLGIEGPIDTRPMDQRNPLGGMKDVTPLADGKLPTKVVSGQSHKLDAAALAATKDAPLVALPAPFKPDVV